jgi:cytosine/adenosine deaminase-related metal-dependent hydrolase
MTIDKSASDEFTLTARWVFPVSAMPLERGLITVCDRTIVAVDPRGSRKADIDLGNVALVPGFVNAHTHLDLSGARGLTPPSSDFVGWLRQVIAYRRSRTPEQVAADIQSGVAESLRLGTTLVGDIAAGGTSWDHVANAPLRADIFYELIGVTAERASAALKDFLWWLADTEPTPTCRPGVSPHAPYSVAEDLYVQATYSGVPVAIHVAESRAELELLAEQRGPFVPFLKEFNAWAPDRLMAAPERVVHLSTTIGPYLFVHGNFLSRDTPIFSGGTVVYCPRTHAAFGHPPHPFHDFRTRGVRVALGTDSLASNPDLSVLAEARFVHARYPQTPGDALLRMATLNGAKALGWADEAGSLEPGKSADFAVVGLPDRDAADPHDLLFRSDASVVATWFRGREVANAVNHEGHKEVHF